MQKFGKRSLFCDQIFCRSDNITVQLASSDCRIVFEKGNYYENENKLTFFPIFDSKKCVEYVFEFQITNRSDYNLELCQGIITVIQNRIKAEPRKEGLLPKTIFNIFQDFRKNQKHKLHHTLKIICFQYLNVKAL